MSKKIIALALIIFIVMTGIGVLVGVVARDQLYKKYNTYNEAIQASTPEQFEMAIKNKKNVIANAAMTTNEPVKDERLDGEYIYISRRHEAYTMDTRVVSTMVNGKSQSRTEVYYRWKYRGMDDFMAPTVSFLGYNFNTSDIEIPNAAENDWIYEGNDRYLYRTIDKNVSGTMFVEFNDDEMSVKFYSGQSIVETIEQQKNPAWIIALAIIWGLLTIGGPVLIIVFHRNDDYYYADKHY